MNLEIEYRYLVDRKFFNSIKDTIVPLVIHQAYLMDKKDFHMRIRIQHPANNPTQKKATLTSKTGKKPLRQEYEVEIPLDYAEILYKNSISTLVKFRYEVVHAGLTWEIDYFPDHNLIVSEVEVSSLDQKISLPDWALKEVTKDNKYSNTTLAKKR